MTLQDYIFVALLFAVLPGAFLALLVTGLERWLGVPRSFFSLIILSSMVALGGLLMAVGVCIDLYEGDHHAYTAPGILLLGIGLVSPAAPFFFVLRRQWFFSLRSGTQWLLVAAVPGVHVALFFLLFTLMGGWEL